MQRDASIVILFILFASVYTAAFLPSSLAISERVHCVQFFSSISRVSYPSTFFFFFFHRNHRLFEQILPTEREAFARRKRQRSPERAVITFQRVCTFADERPARLMLQRAFTVKFTFTSCLGQSSCFCLLRYIGELSYRDMSARIVG